MKTVTIGLSAAALMLAGTAIAAPGTMKGDATGTVTRAQAQTAAAERFARMDQNKDGKIDQTDRQLRREARKAERFAALDTDKNGQISKAEFMAERPQGRRGNRMVAAGEAGETGKRWGKHHGRHHGGRMMGGKMADANKDRAITQAEFTAAAMQRFDAMDTNKDSQVTQAERQATREQMKAKWQQMRQQAPARAPQG